MWMDDPTSCIKHASGLGFVTQHPPGSNECYKACPQLYPCLCSFISWVYPYACSYTSTILRSIVSTCLSLGSYTEVVSCVPVPLIGYTNTLDHNKLQTPCSVYPNASYYQPKTNTVLHHTVCHSMGLMRWSWGQGLLKVRQLVLGVNASLFQ